MCRECVCAFLIYLSIHQTTKVCVWKGVYLSSQYSVVLMTCLWTCCRHAVWEGDAVQRFKRAPPALKFKALPPATDPNTRKLVPNHRWVWSAAVDGLKCLGLKELWWRSSYTVDTHTHTDEECNSITADQCQTFSFFFLCCVVTIHAAPWNMRQAAEIIKHETFCNLCVGYLKKCHHDSISVPFNFYCL